MLLSMMPNFRGFVQLTTNVTRPAKQNSKVCVSPALMMDLNLTQGFIGFLNREKKSDKTDEVADDKPVGVQPPPSATIEEVA